MCSSDLDAVRVHLFEKPLDRGGTFGPRDFRADGRLVPRLVVEGPDVHVGVDDAGAVGPDGCRMVAGEWWHVRCPSVRGEFFVDKGGIGGLPYAWPVAIAWVKCGRHSET